MFEPSQNSQPWGFRFSGMDAAVIGVFAVAATALSIMESPLWWLLTIVAGHFFLFCNVLRVRRSLELVWAALFLANVAVWSSLDRLSCAGVLAGQLPVTAVLALIELRSQQYHGILAQRINPRLNDYLEQRRL